MAVEVDATVGTIDGVEDDVGDIQSPANLSEQQEANSKLAALINHLGTLIGIERNADVLDTVRIITESTNAEQLPDGTVADGGSILVTPLRGNSGSVYVGDENNQPVTLEGPGDSFGAQVSGQSEIWIRTPNAGDGVGLVVER